MAISGSDISYVYSGGAVNNNPTRSLGGEASSTIFVDGLNTLFDDVSEAESVDGSIDYRCFYVMNTSASETLFDAFFSIDDQVTGGASIEIGVEIATDVQRLAISGTVTGGSMDLSYDGNTFSVAYNANLVQWGNNLQSALNALFSLSGVVVSTNSNSGTNFFEISFEGLDDDRNHPLIEIEDLSGLTGSGISGTITKLQEGGPINAEAQQIINENTSPNNVTFSASSISFGDFLPLDIVAIWVRRTTSPGTDAILNDGVTFKMSGSPI